MAIEISFSIGTLNDALPNVKDKVRYPFVDDYLRAKLQSDLSCDTELSWIASHESGEIPNDSAIFGNLIQRRLDGQHIKLMFSFPFDDDPNDFGDPTVIPLADIKEVILKWRDFLVKVRSVK